MRQSVNPEKTVIVVIDIGGTHVRFAIARVVAGERPELGEAMTMRTSEHASLKTAWESFARESGKPVPNYAAISVAAALTGDTIKMTNNPWVISQSTLAEDLGLEKLTLLNDFGSIAHATTVLDENELLHICGPDKVLPKDGLVSVIGPGTGLGVAMVIIRNGQEFVVETEAGHTDFAPLDQVETAILDRLRERYLRVSVERIVSGPGLTNIYEAIALIEGLPVKPLGDADLWAAAIAGEDSLAAAALDRFCLAYGSTAGDVALTQGAKAVVLAGGLSQRIRHKLCQPEFASRFCAKGRFEHVLAALPVKLIDHPQPGLLGAAVAYTGEHLG
jgi:glucokinase